MNVIPHGSERSPEVGADNAAALDLVTNPEGKVVDIDETGGFTAQQRRSVAQSAVQVPDVVE